MVHEHLPRAAASVARQTVSPHPAIGPAISGSPDVLINGRPALRIDDIGVHAACCDDLLRRFASREVVMSITGHSTPAMHSHYSHVDAGEKAAAVGKVIELVTKASSDQQRGEFLDPEKLAAASG